MRPQRFFRASASRCQALAIAPSTAQRPMPQCRPQQRNGIGHVSSWRFLATTWSAWPPPVCMPSERNQPTVNCCNCARGAPSPSHSMATLIGRLKRRGPALPGLMYSTPARVCTSGLCE